MQFKSKFEARIAQAHPEAEYEPVRITYTRTQSYRPDWRLPSGVLVESKGFWRPEERSMLLLIREQHPHLDVRMLLQEPNKKLTKAKGSKTYSQWCDAHQIIWAKGPSIPDAWIH